EDAVVVGDQDAHSGACSGWWGVRRWCRAGWQSGGDGGGGDSFGGLGLAVGGDAPSLVAALFFGAIEECVSGAQQGVRVGVLGASAGDAEADGDVDALAVAVGGGVGDGQADAFGDADGHVVGHVGTDDEELLAADATADVVAP